MKVLVTGASGFLGKHLIKTLLENNFQVVALMRKTSDINSLNSLKCEIVYGDILDLPSLILAFKNLDGVFHVAGYMSSDPRDNQKLMDINVQGVKNVLSACIQNKVPTLVHVSSVVAVGVNREMTDPLLTEESKNITDGLGFSNYDSKRMGEELVIEAARKGDIKGIVVNPGLIYGAEDAKKTIRKGNVLAAKGKLPIYPSGGVSIVAVEDVAEAMIKAFSVGRNGERYLLTGDNITIKELLTTISELAGAKPPTRQMPMKFLLFIAKILRFIGIKSELCPVNIFSASVFHWYDCSKAKRELGFNPKPYRVALKSSVDWMRDNHLL